MLSSGPQYILVSVNQYFHIWLPLDTDKTEPAFQKTLILFPSYALCLFLHQTPNYYVLGQLIYIKMC